MFSYTKVYHHCFRILYWHNVLKLIKPMIVLYVKFKESYMYIIVTIRCGSVTNHIVLSQVSEGLSDPGGNQVRRVTKEDGTIGFLSITGVQVHLINLLLR